MQRLVRISLCLLWLAGIVGVTNTAWSQEVTGAIVGTVIDPSGAPITGATLIATDTQRGSTWNAQTNATGAFNIPRIPVGTYSVTATSPGFDTAIYPSFTLVLNQTARLEFKMTVGRVSQSVEVVGSLPVLQTDDAVVSSVLDARSNDNLPLQTRNFVQLALLSPGAVSVDPKSMNTGSNVAEEGGRPYINGNREQANNFLLDGIDNNQASENLVGFTPSPDAIGEFSVITQNASAEFGNYSGGIVNATIKSGTNNYHGDVFEFFRNDIFDANQWENGLGYKTPNVGVLPTPKLRWNMFGATFGGPIIKNKLFFFVDYQGGRLDHPATVTEINVVTPDEMGGNFSALCKTGFSAGICNDRTLDALGNPTVIADQLYNPCAAGTGISGSPCSIQTPASRAAFAGNIIPTTMIDPVFTSLVTNSLYPKSVATLGNGFGEAFNTTNQQYTTDQGDLKMDYNLSEKDRFSGRYSKGSQFDPLSNSVALLGSSANTASLFNTTLNWTHTFSPNLINEARVGVNYVRFSQGIFSFDSAVGVLGNTIGIADGNPAGITGLPLLAFGGGTANAVKNGTLTNLGNADTVENFTSSVIQFDDGLVYTHGRHIIKTGFQVNRYRLNIFYSGNAGELGAEVFGSGPGGNYTGNGNAGDASADWALGLPESVGRGTSSGGWHQRDSLFAGYVQDDWRATNDLTVNLGLRYEARTPWVETNNRQVSVNKFTGVLEYPGNDTVVGDGTNGFSNGLYKSVYGLADFQPRIGLAWSPAALDHKMVIRSAYSMSSYLEGTGTNLRLTQNPPFTPPQVQASNVATGTAAYTTANGFSVAAPPTGDPFTGATLLTWDPTVQPAIAQQWNLTVQQQIARDTTIQIGYVGQNTTHLMVPEWLTQGDLLPNGNIVYPFVGGPNAPSSGLTGFGPNQLGALKDTASTGRMNYNALQVVLQKRFSRGLETQVSWTYSKCMTDNIGYYGTWGTTTQAAPAENYGQNVYDPHADYAQCYWDTKHIISAYALYEIPFGRGKQFGHNLPTAVNAIAGNWSINPIVSFHTGFPIALYGSDDSGTGSVSPRPNCNGPVVYPKTTSPTGLQWVSSSAFSQPSPGTFGDCPAQGPVVGPGYVDADISLQKNFLLTETKKLQFRADFLNAFNHPNLAHPDNSVGDANFGVITGSQDARELQFALKFYF